MKSRDKMLAAMTNGLRSDFSVVIPYLGIFLRDHWYEITNQPWWVLNNQDVSLRLKIEEELQKKIGIDWVPCGMCQSREWRETHRVETQGNRVFLVNTSSRIKEEIQREPVGGAHVPIEAEPLIKSMEDVDKHVEIIDETTLIQSGRLDYARMVAEKFGSEKFVFASIGTPYWTALHQPYLGFKGMMIDLFKRPKLVEYTLEKLLISKIEQLRAYAKVGVDGVWVEECLGSADEISLAQFERFVLPYTEEVISEIRRLGMKSIYYPCGDVRDRMEPMIESNPDCLSLEESKKGFKLDLEWVDKTVAGRTCIFGNLDAIRFLQNGTRSELTEEIRRQVNIGRSHGKFVMSIGSPVTPKTPVSRVKEYVDIARQESKTVSPS